jgi:hypothetical protein
MVRSRLAFAAVAMAALALSTTGRAVAAGEEPTIISPLMTPVPSLAKWVKLKPQYAVEWSGEALGLLRGAPDSEVPLGYRLTNDMIRFVEYTGAGLAPDVSAGQAPKAAKVEKAVIGYDYRIPAVRLELEGGGAHKVQVAAAGRAWDEESPGAGGRSVEGAAQERSRLIWLSPHGAVLAALRAGPAAKVSIERGRGVISYQLDGMPIKIVLDQAMRPARVEMRAGGRTYVGEYSGYKDFVGYSLICPAKMKQSVDGQVLMDLTVSTCLVNAYTAFAPPST